MKQYPATTIKSLLSKLKKDNVQFVEFQFTDYLGNVKSESISVRDVPSAFEKGLWFDGSSVEGFARIQESDMYLVPDPDSYALIPWRKTEAAGSAARLICDVYQPDGKPFVGDPRNILKRVLEKTKKLGFSYMVGPEVEFFLFDKDDQGKLKIKSPGNGYYFTFSLDEMYEIKLEMVKDLEEMGIMVEASHYEVAGKQHEIDVRYDDALKMADNTITLKYTLKAVAAKHGMQAVFMPKPIYGVNGSGMHVHQSLFRGNVNAFYSDSDKYHLSRIAYQFLAGQLKHVKEISAVIAPTVNSYKRLTPGFEAPVNICWARKNRSALIRIPEVSQGNIRATRLELRCPDPSSNPYLTFAVMLAAGIEGINGKLKAPEPVEEDVYDLSEDQLKSKSIDHLPGSLIESLDYLKSGKLVKETLGEDTYLRYLATKQREWDAFRTWVTEWETDRYLNT